MIRGAYNLVLDILYPEFCLNCGKYGQVLCTECFLSMELSQTDTCFFCGRISKEGRICPSCKRSNDFLIEKMVWAGSYKDKVLKEALHEFKYSGVFAVGEILGEVLCRRLVKWLNHGDNLVVVPIPLHINKFKKRGFNQSELLARAISRRFNLEGGLALSRIRETQTQVGLSRGDRQKNLDGAIICSDPELIIGRNILLIDDVVTTGSTINECAKVLKSAGAKKIYAVAVARG